MIIVRDPVFGTSIRHNQDSTIAKVKGVSDTIIDEFAVDPDGAWITGDQITRRMNIAIRVGDVTRTEDQFAQTERDQEMR